MVTLSQAKQIREEESGGFVSGAIDVARNFNTGLARTLGIPRAIVDLNEQLGGAIFSDIGRHFGQDKEQREEPGINLLPTSSQIQEAGSRVGMTFAPGEEPDTLAARTVQNIGAAAPILPFFGLTAPILVTEAVASVTGAGGGILLQQTEWGKRNPEIARAIGEIGGGITGAFSIPIARFLAKGGSIGTVIRFIKRLIPGGKKRALSKLKDIEFTPKTALEELERMEKIPEGKFLLPGQAAGTSGTARLTKTVEEEVPRVGAIIERQRIRAVNELQKQFTKTGDIGDARLLLEEKLALKADQATKALSKIDKVGDSAVLSTRSEKILSVAQKEGQDVLDEVWENLDDIITTPGNNLKSVITDEYKNIMERGVIDEIDIKQISFSARAKLGTLNKKGKLVGGSLFKKPKTEKVKSLILDTQGRPIQQVEDIIEEVEPSAKAIHRLYSTLGAEKERLGRIGGQGNKIRIINKLREAALDDLDEIGVGGSYKETINLTRKFHDKFTKGTVGKILGRARGETPSPVTALEDIIGTGGVKAKENIIQAMQASPQMKSQISEFLKVKFAEVAVNDKTHRIDARAGNAFLKKFGNILDDIFPKLKGDLKDAIAKQIDVDEFIGAPIVSELSPLIKEKTAAGFFLGRNPGEEMSALLRRTTKRTAFLSELVKTSKADPTGKAFRGLQNSFTEEMLKHGNADDIAKLSGTKMIKKLKEVEDSALKSGLFSKDEYNKLQRIGDVFRKIEIEKGAKALKGGIPKDPLSILVALPGRFLGARLGGRAGQEVGSSLVLAGAGSKTITDSLKKLTNDEMQNLLIRFVTDKKLAKDMLAKLTKLSAEKKVKLWVRILEKAKEVGGKTAQRIKGEIPRPPITGIVPAAASAGKSISDADEQEQRVERFNLLKRGK